MGRKKAMTSKFGERLQHLEEMILLRLIKEGMVTSSPEFEKKTNSLSTISMVSKFGQCDD